MYAGTVRHQSHGTCEEDRYSEQDISSTRQGDTDANRNASNDSIMEESPSSLISQLERAESSRREYDASDITFPIQEVSEFRQGEREQSFWPVTTAGTTAQPLPLVTPSALELSKSQQLSQAMNYMYY